jgi:hypothetical protein
MWRNLVDDDSESQLGPGVSRQPLQSESPEDQERAFNAIF